MNRLLTWLILSLTALLLAGCSGTTMSGSWRSPEYQGQVDKVYIVGMSQQETSRRLFEDEFGRQLAVYDVEALSSYLDFPVAEEANREIIAEKMAANGSEMLLLSKVIGKRTQQVVTPGRVSSYSYGPYYSRRGYYNPYPYSQSWGSYYNRNYQIVYEPATVTDYEIITIESVLFDTRSDELIWSAQLETVVEGSLEKMVTDFIETVVKDLVEHDLI